MVEFVRLAKKDWDVEEEFMGRSILGNLCRDYWVGVVGANPSKTAFEVVKA